MKLGGSVKTSCEGCSHLVASGIKRTVKFLAALSTVKHIVTPDWVQQSVTQGRFAGKGIINSFHETLKRPSEGFQNQPKVVHDYFAPKQE